MDDSKDNEGYGRCQTDNICNQKRHIYILLKYTKASSLSFEDAEYECAY
jgi:hypothetical protein